MSSSISACAFISTIYHLSSIIAQSMESGLEQERVQQETELNHKLNEEEVQKHIH